MTELQPALLQQEQPASRLDRIRDVALQARQKLGRVGAVGLLVAGGTTVEGAIDADPAYAAGEQATIGMPFSGKWAYDAIVTPPYTDQNSSHPSKHNPYGFDWSTDLYAPADTDVKVYGSSAQGTVTFQRNGASDTCSSQGPNIAGQGVTFDVLVNGAEVGEVKYDHIDPIDVGNNPIASGTKIGEITSESLNSSCYQVRHAHIQLKNTVMNRSCYVDRGNPGTQVSEGHSIGVLGSANTAIQEACSTVPNAPTSAGRVAIINGAGAAYAKDEISPGGWHRLTNDGEAAAISASGTQVAVRLNNGQVWKADVSPANLAANNPGLAQMNIPLEPGYSGGVKQIEVDKNGNMIAINNCDRVYGYRNLAGHLSWVSMSACGYGKQVSIGNGRMAVVNSCNGINQSDAPGYGWSGIMACNDGKAVEIGETGRIMIINGANTAYIYDVTTGTWVNKSAVGDAAKIAIGKDVVMVISNGGSVTAANVGANPQTAMTELTQPGEGLAISAGANDRMMFRSSGGIAYASDVITYGGQWTGESDPGDALKVTAG